MQINLLNPHQNLWSRYYNYGGTEAQNGEVTCISLRSYKVPSQDPSPVSVTSRSVFVSTTLS